MRCAHFCPHRCLASLREFCGDSHPRSFSSPPFHRRRTSSYSSCFSAAQISQLIACRIMRPSPCPSIKCACLTQSLHRQKTEMHHPGSIQFVQEISTRHVPRQAFVYAAASGSAKADRPATRAPSAHRHWSAHSRISALFCSSEICCASLRRASSSNSARCSSLDGLAA